MSIETIRLSEKERNQLKVLKKKTGIENWNVLCRWAFCLSLSEASRPPAERISSESSIEMTWKTFGGIHSDVYLALLRQRAKIDGITLSEENEITYFRLHLHRGISYLHQRISRDPSIESLLSLASSH